MPFCFRCTDCSTLNLFGGVRIAGFCFCGRRCASHFFNYRGAVDVTAQGAPVWECSLEPGDPGVVEAQVRAMAHVEPDVRKRVARWLQHHKDPRATRALVGALTDAEPAVRFAAVVALELRVSEAWVCKSVAEALTRDNDVRVREGAVYSLAKAPGEATSTALIEGLTDSQAKVRRAAALALGARRDALAVPALIDRLRDEDAEVCAEAASSLGTLGDVRAVDPMHATIASRPSALLRAEVGRSLWLLGDGRAPSIVFEVLESADPQARQLATASLALRKHPEAAQRLRRRLGDASAAVRAEACAALGRIGDRQMIDCLIAMLRDAESQVRAAAAGALREVPDLRSLTALRVAIRDVNYQVRLAAAEALAKVDDDGEAFEEVMSIGDHRTWVGSHDLKGLRLSKEVASACDDRTSVGSYELEGLRLSRVQGLLADLKVQTEQRLVRNKANLSDQASQLEILALRALEAKLRWVEAAQEACGAERAVKPHFIEALQLLEPPSLDIRAWLERARVELMNARFAIDIAPPAPTDSSDPPRQEPLRLPSATPPASQADQALVELGGRLIHTKVSKDHVLKRDISHVSQIVEMMRLSIAETGRLDGTLHYTIDGYNSDSRELFEVPEVVRWARKLQGEHPHILLMLHEETALLHLVLVCGVVAGTSPGMWVPEPDRCAALLVEFEAAVLEFARALGVDTNEQIRYSIDVRKGAVLSSVARYGRKDATGTSGGGDGGRTLADFLNGLIPIFPVPESTMQSMEAITGSAAALESARLLFGPEGRWMMLGMGSMGPGGSPPVAIAFLLRFARGSEDGPPRRDALRLLKRLFISVGRQHAFDLEQGGLSWPAELEKLDPSQMELLTGDGTTVDSSKFAQ